MAANVGKGVRAAVKVESAEPVIVPRSDHGISRSRIDPDALKVLYRLHNSGHKGYLVGGSVRDLLLGREPRDFDIGTDAHPNQVRRLFRNCRVIGRRFRLAHILFPGGKIIEVATFRCMAEPDAAQTATPGGKVNFNSFGTPGEDARRRDITINGLFYDIATFSVIDYVGGLNDLRQGIVRTIKDPAESFQEDPVRIIRVLRHAARCGFRIEEKTWRELMARQQTVMSCSMDRVREEFLKDLGSGRLAPILELFHAAGFLYTLFPELEIKGRGHQPERIDFLNRLMGAAAEIDRIVADSPESPASPFLLAVLLMPYFSRDAWKTPPDPDQDLVAYLVARIKVLLDPLMHRLRIPKEQQTEIRHRIVMAERLRQALSATGRFPPFLRAKSDYAAGLELLRADLQRRGEDTTTLDGAMARAGERRVSEIAAEAEDTRPRRRRRRGGRGRRHGTARESSKAGAPDRRLQDG